MTARTSLDVVTIDSATPRTLATFWCEVLVLQVVEDEDDARWLCLADGGGRRVLGIQRTAAPSAATRPASRLHLDLVCALVDFEAERARVLACGASERRAVRREAYGAIANLADPEGNLFDLCAYDETGSA